MHISYEIRTTLGRPALAFDNLDRAKHYRDTHKHMKGWRIFKITKTVEEVA